MVTNPTKPQFSNCSFNKMVEWGVHQRAYAGLQFLSITSRCHCPVTLTCSLYFTTALKVLTWYFFGPWMWVRVFTAAPSGRHLWPVSDLPHSDVFCCWLSVQQLAVTCCSSEKPATGICAELGEMKGCLCGGQWPQQIRFVWAWWLQGSQCQPQSCAPLSKRSREERNCLTN